MPGNIKKRNPTSMSIETRIFEKIYLKKRCFLEKRSWITGFSPFANFKTIAMTPKERILFAIQKAIPTRINSKIGISNQSIMRDKKDTPTTIPKTKRKNRK